MFSVIVFTNIEHFIFADTYLSAEIPPIARKLVKQGYDLFEIRHFEYQSEANTFRDKIKNMTETEKENYLYS